jgi:sarcosine oxidase
MTYDVIVVGLGAMGSATLYQLAKRGVKVLGIDRFAPPHDQGSSHGETRVTRQGVSEGSPYVPLAIRSHEIWRELEALTRYDLLLTCGFLAIDGTAGRATLHGKPRFVDASAANAQRFGIAHEVIGPEDARQRFPQFKLNGDEQIYFEPGGGIVFPENCIRAHMECAIMLGATARTDEMVKSIRPDGDGVCVETTVGRYRSDRAVISAGSWTPGFFPKALGEVRLLRQVLHWYRPDNPQFYAATRSPAFLWLHGPNAEDSFYGIPIVPGSNPAVKIACEQYSDRIEMPEALDRTVSPQEARSTYDRHLAGRLVGLSSRVLHSVVCLYTFAPDGDFVIDADPENDRILVVSACSGHGFKHSAGVGEHVADLLVADGAKISDFSINRPSLG